MLIKYLNIDKTMQTKLILTLVSIRQWLGTILVSNGTDIYKQSNVGNKLGVESVSEIKVKTK